MWISRRGLRAPTASPLAYLLHSPLPLPGGGGEGEASSARADGDEHSTHGDSARVGLARRVEALTCDQSQPGAFLVAQDVQILRLHMRVLAYAVAEKRLPTDPS